MVFKILSVLKHYPPRLELQLPVRIIVLISECSVAEDVVVPVLFNGQRKLHKNSQILFIKSLEI